MARRRGDLDVTSPVAPITVLVPVYRGLGEIRRCLESVLRWTPESERSFRLHVIDDASPEDDVRRLVEELGERSFPFEVITRRHDVNAGFVGTVNEGFDEAPGDVVVLNADTVVTYGWLDRLAATADDADVATVTPLTNFGSICTVPEDVRSTFALDDDAPRVDEFAAYVQDRSLHLRPEIITGVGFCMYVTRTALEAVGRLDERSFGRGYGEEVDFCLRAGRLGFRHLVEDGTYVHHQGGGSFGDERPHRLAAASEVLHKRYGFFRAANRAERRRDPLAPVFANLQLGLHERDTSRPHVLHLIHSRPGALGGTEKHTEALMEALSDEFDFSILFPVASGFVLRTRWYHAGSLTELEFLFPGGPRRVEKVADETAEAALRMVLLLFDLDAVHIQNLIGHSLSPLGALSDFEGPVIYSLRDLFLACPNHSLLYRDDSPCGVPSDLSVCADCLPVTRDMPVEALVDHREYVRHRLGSIDHVVAASESSVDYLLRAFDVPREKIVHIEHGSILPLDIRRRDIDEVRVYDEPLRIASLGLGRLKKGFDRVARLAQDLSGEGIEVHHFGQLEEPPSPALITHGWYDNRYLPALLDAAGIQVVLLPGPYAETFGHVMTEALLAGLPVIGAEYGALGERIKRHGVGWTIDPMDYDGIRDLVLELNGDRYEIHRATERVVSMTLRSVADTAPEYAELYRDPSTSSTDAPMGVSDRSRDHLRAMAASNRRLLTELDRDPVSVDATDDPGHRALAARVAELEHELRGLKSRRILRFVNAIGKIRRSDRGTMHGLRQLWKALTTRPYVPDATEIERSSRRGTKR